MPYIVCRMSQTDRRHESVERRIRPSRRYGLSFAFCTLVLCFHSYLYSAAARASSALRSASPEQAAETSGQEMQFTWDFETGDLLGWEKVGNAFDYQPTLHDNPTARGGGEPSNHQGSYWIGTHERFQGRDGQSPGDIQGDGPQGALTSPAFTIPSGTLSFLIGGGSHVETRVELVIVDNMQREARVMAETGKNTETMERVTWDLHPLAGRLGRIRIVDESSDAWGHINADDFRLEGNVAVPEVIGHNLSDAKKILAGTHLELGQVTKVGSGAEPQTVLQQDPAAGTEVPIGTSVTLHVAAMELIAVPDLRGHSREEAESTLKKERLRLGEVTKRFSDQPEGTIVWQNPAAETKVPVGTAVDLWTAVSAPVEVPNLRGRPIKEVEEILKEAGLRCGQVSKRLSYQAEGTVVSQDPIAGTLAHAGAAVDLWVAVRVLVKVPEVRGHAVEEAEQILRKARLHLGQRFDHFSEEEPGTVLRQSPAAGTRVFPDSTVDLYVASREMIDVPDLRGHSRWEAEEIIKDVRLSVGEVSEYSTDREEDLVVVQDPAAGTTAPIGSAVHLWVMVGGSVDVPDLRGFDRQEAEVILSEVRLRSGGIFARSCGQQEGTIVGQNPAAGTRVPAGTAVTLWVAAESGRPTSRWLGIITGTFIILGGGCYVLIRFPPNSAVSLRRTGRRVKVLLRRRGPQAVFRRRRRKSRAPSP